MTGSASRNFTSASSTSDTSSSVASVNWPCDCHGVGFDSGLDLGYVWIRVSGFVFGFRLILGLGPGSGAGLWIEFREFALRRRPRASTANALAEFVTAHEHSDATRHI